MDKPLFTRVTSLIRVELLKLEYYLYSWNCELSQPTRPFLRFEYAKIL